MAFDFGNIISGAFTGAVKGISDIVHSWVTTNKDKQLAEADATELNARITMLLADIEQKSIDAANAAQAAEDANITERWRSDMTSESWLSKNIRPMVLASLLGFTFIIIIADSFQYTFRVDKEWVSMIESLLMTVFIAYFGGRTYEKVTSIKNK